MTSSTNPTETLLREEVEFWRQLIHEREKRREPVLPRMREALAYAEHKLQVHLSSGRHGAGLNEQITDQWLH